MSERLTLFGEVLEAARREASLTQRDLAKAYLERDGGQADEAAVANAQSFIAKLEKGRVLHPQPDLISWLSKKLCVEYGQIISALIKDKYLPIDLRPITYPLEKGVKTLRQLAEWEGSDEHTEIWIVAERYVDDHLREFRDAVTSVLSRGGTIVFFLPQGRQEEFDEYKVWMSEHLKAPLDDRLIMVPLSLDQSALIAAPFVLANPSVFTGPYPQGFVFINNADGQPCTAIRMSREEAFNRARSLAPVKSRALRLGSLPSSEITQKQVR